jgi:hypothetical protein
MALVMVQGHVMDALLTRESLAAPWYVFQQMFHGSTAPGFLFASGFVAGLPRAPLSLRASVRRARRLLFVLGVGYFLHLPYYSFWKSVGTATPAERALFWSCDALQAIAVTQLAVLGLQWLAGRRWTRVAAALAVVVIVATPFVWASGVSTAFPVPIAPYLDERTGSRFPLFPFSAFVLAGTLAGATLGRAEPALRHRRIVRAGGVLVGAGLLLALVLADRVDFWGPSPAYVLVRLGGLLLLMRGVEWYCARERPGTRALALLGHETLLVYVLHLHLLFGGALGVSPLGAWAGRLGAASAFGVVLAMLPVLLATAWLWRAAKQRAPHEAQAALVWFTLFVLWNFFDKPW